MNAIDIKAELKKLIENENDITILESLRVLLKRSSLDSALKDKLSTRALESEDDIKNGRYMSKSELLSKLDA
jgi:hypothetical protein